MGDRHLLAPAVGRLERALSLREARPGKPEELAETQLALARALWTRRRDRKRAIDLATQAVKGFEAAGERASRERDAAAAWLAKRTGRSAERRR